MTSQNFVSKCLSLDNLKVRDRCGLMSLAAHRRWTVAFETPAIRAMLRQLHRPSVAGGVTALSSTMRTAAGGREGLRPRPAASSNPVRRLARKRWHQWLTVTRDTPTRAAIRSCGIPAALSITISARCRSRTATVVALIRRSNSRLSAASNTILLRTTASPKNGIAAASTKARILSSYFRDATLGQQRIDRTNLLYCPKSDQQWRECATP